MKTIGFSDQYKKAIISILTVFYILIAIFGGFTHFSPVPFWDMWEGYIQFLTNVQKNDYSVWWAQHNEHRIVFARLLFWVDLHVFNGSIAFLIIVNYLMAAGIFLTFLSIINTAFPRKNTKNLRFIAIITVAVFSFSWIQNENLTWAFQGQFFAAYLFPLLAFYLMFLSTIKKNQILFFLAVLMGMASAGTTANGILALPFMVFLALFFKLGWKKIALLTILSCISLAAYFFEYYAIPQHGSLLTGLREQPLQVLQYILAYLGAPLYHAIKHSFLAVFPLGAFIVMSCIFFLYKILSNLRWHSKQDKLLIALLFFMAYIGATAIGTAGGRLIFGIEQALISRYCTPALMAWSCLLIMYFIFFTEKLLAVGNKIYFVLLIPALLFPYQVLELREQYKPYFDRKVAALALELGIPDGQQINFIFPANRAVELIEKTEYARENHWSIFNDFQIKDTDQMIGQTYVQKTTEKCAGNFDIVQEFSSESTYVRVSGWIYDPKLSDVPQKVFIVSKGDEKIIGYAITGQPRADVAKHMGRGAMDAGFKGYLLKSYANQEQIILAGVAPECTLSAKVLPLEKTS